MKDRRIIWGTGLRLIKECRHCGREYQDQMSSFCSVECAEEAS